MSENVDRGAGSRGPFRTLLEDLQRGVELLGGSVVPTESYRPGEHEPLVSFQEPPDTVEIDRYWLNAPFAFASIQYDDAEDEHQYFVVEPSLDPDERALLDALFQDVREPLLYARHVSGDPEGALMTELRTRLEEYAVEVTTAEVYRLFYYLHRRFRGFGKIDPLMYDPNIEDISCDGYDVPLFVYHDDYQDVETNVSFDERELDSYVIRMAQQAGRHISVGSPVVETTLADGSRAELALGREVTPRGSAFTVRKYSEDPFTPIDLLDVGTFTLAQLAYLWMAIEHNKNLVFAGGTAAGKTTSMNAISMFIPPRAKVITIEDTRELSLFHDNWLSAVTRERLEEGANISMYDLLRSSLRHRPEYIIVGEVRGEEANTLFQAMNTGHTTLSTIHADSVQTVINRLENEPINVPRPMVQSLDVLCVQVLTRLGGERVRRVQDLAEIEGIDARTGELDYSSAFRWDATDDSVEEGTLSLMEEIRSQRGWTREDLLRELRRRRRVLAYLREEGVTGYRRFTATINRYYADPDAVMTHVEERGVEAPADG